MNSEDEKDLNVLKHKVHMYYYQKDFSSAYQLFLRLFEQGKSQKKFPEDDRILVAAALECAVKVKDYQLARELYCFLANLESSSSITDAALTFLLRKHADLKNTCPV